MKKSSCLPLAAAAALLAGCAQLTPEQAALLGTLADGAPLRGLAIEP